MSIPRISEFYSEGTSPYKEGTGWKREILLGTMNHGDKTYRICHVTKKHDGCWRLQRGFLAFFASLLIITLISKTIRNLWKEAASGLEDRKIGLLIEEKPKDIRIGSPVSQSFSTAASETTITPSLTVSTFPEKAIEPINPLIEVVPAINAVAVAALEVVAVPAAVEPAPVESPRPLVEAAPVINAVAVAALEVVAVPAAAVLPPEALPIPSLVEMAAKNAAVAAPNVAEAPAATVPAPIEPPGPPLVAATPIVQYPLDESLKDYLSTLQNHLNAISPALSEGWGLGWANLRWRGVSEVSLTPEYQSGPFSARLASFEDQLPLDRESIDDFLWEAHQFNDRLNTTMLALNSHMRWLIDNIGMGSQATEGKLQWILRFIQHITANELPLEQRRIQIIIDAYRKYPEDPERYAIYARMMNSYLPSTMRYNTAGAPLLMMREGGVHVPLIKMDLHHIFKGEKMRMGSKVIRDDRGRTIAIHKKLNTRNGPVVFDLVTATPIISPIA